MILTGFEPDLQRARSLDARQHAELGSSLAYLAEASRASDAAIASEIARVAARLGAGRRVPSQVFAAYYLLVEAVASGDRDGAETALRLISLAPDRPQERRLRWLGNPEDAAFCELLQSRLNETSMAMAPLTREDADQFAGLLDQGLALLDRAFPELGQEIGALNHEVLLAKAANPRATDFDGASHYQFWGLVVLNPDHHRTPLQVVEVLAHEVSHGLLFGLTVDEPLVFNPDEERFPSPLRRDPRPMDGIFHAAYVSARMSMAMEHLAVADGLSAEDREKARAAAALDRENFLKGDKVIREHGRLSETGLAVIGAARDWISRSADATLPG